MIQIEDNINISKYNPFAGSSYMILPKELDHPRKRLININFDSEILSRIFKSCRSSHSKNYESLKRIDFKDIKFPVKTKDIHNTEKREFQWH